MVTWILALFGAYMLVALLIYALQGQMVWSPGNRTITATPKDFGLEFEEFFLKLEGRVSVHGWLIPPPETPPLDGVQAQEPLWVHFSHGNAGNISHRMDTIRLLHDLGMGVCIYDYRGYGRSLGETSEQGTYEDARAVWQHLKERVAPERIVIWGHSLGGAVAAWLAAELQGKDAPAALVVESAFTSVPDVGKKSYPFLPVKLLCRYKYDTVASVAGVKSPVLIVHSPDDEVIPYAMGRTIFENAADPKEFLEIHGSHNNGFLESGELYTQGVRRFLEAHIGG